MLQARRDEALPVAEATIHPRLAEAEYHRRIALGVSGMDLPTVVDLHLLGEVHRAAPSPLTTPCRTPLRALEDLVQDGVLRWVAKDADQLGPDRSTTLRLQVDPCVPRILRALHPVAAVELQ